MISSDSTGRNYSLAPGRIHSLETLGALDGPGLRLVIFLQGCPLACRYCQNPDTWDRAGGQQMTVGELFRRAGRMRPYFGSSGGVTLSGGEPLHQLDFSVRLFSALKSAGISTVLDTSGWLPPDSGDTRCGINPDQPKQSKQVEALLKMTDLVILDVKSPDPSRFQWLTGRDIEPLHCFLDHLQWSGCRTWIRQVIVPGWNDKPSDLQELAGFLARWPDLFLEKVELLPYHTFGKAKWDKLNRPYALPDFPPMSDKVLADLQHQIDRLVSASRTGSQASHSAFSE